jgi:hypothetical protein
MKSKKHRQENTSTPFARSNLVFAKADGLSSYFKLNPKNLNSLLIFNLSINFMVFRALLKLHKCWAFVLSNGMSVE